MTQVAQGPNKESLNVMRDSLIERCNFELRGDWSVLGPRFRVVPTELPGANSEGKILACKPARKPPWDSNLILWHVQTTHFLKFPHCNFGLKTSMKNGMNSSWFLCQFFFPSELTPSPFQARTVEVEGEQESILLFQLGDVYLPCLSIWDMEPNVWNGEETWKPMRRRRSKRRCAHLDMDSINSVCQRTPSARTRSIV